MTSAARGVPGYDAVVLAGGAGRRLGAADKPAVAVAGVPLLERVLAAVSAADTVVVVGERRPLDAAVVWCREQPPGGGPAAGLAAAVPALSSAHTVVVAADLALLDAVTIDSLVAALDAAGPDVDGVVAAGADERPQWLVGAWRTTALRDCGLGPSASLRDTLGGLRWRAMPVDDRLLLDCDTPADVARAEALLAKTEQHA